LTADHLGLAQCVTLLIGRDLTSFLDRV